MVRRQAGIGARCDGDGVFGVVRDADEGGAGGRVGATHDVGLHAGLAQRLLQRLGMGIRAESQQHVGRGRAGACGGHGLVGALAAGMGGQRMAEHGFARCRDVPGAHDEVEIGGTSDENHG